MIQEVNEKNFQEMIEKSTDKMVVMFYRESGCPNCDRTKPVFEEFAKKNPNIKCFKYKCEGDKPDSVTSNYQFRMFPGIFSFDRWQCVRGFSGEVNMERLNQIFIGLKDLKAQIYDEMNVYAITEKRIQVLNDEIRLFILPQNASVPSPLIPSDNFELPDPAPGSEKLPEPCEGCQ